jgi:glycosyltransferase involved in cell wall biosynthesis
MKITFMHYHLKPGGVTSCLKQQVHALKDDCDVLVITGEAPNDAFPADTIIIPELAYSTHYAKPFHARDVAETIIDAIQTRFNGPCDILHVHNPMLAKNKKLLQILKTVQKRGVCLLLQVHDFAEDGRPQSYYGEDYPQDCHYSVVNSRDYNILLRSGLKKEGLHLISNTVKLPDDQTNFSIQGADVVYPIRAIRRKNIGEAILLSLFLKKDDRLAITLPPNSQVDIESYEDWKAFVTDHHLNVEFERGLNQPFEAIMRSARFLLTTSITEGFGFTFLEPWLFNRLVWGRKLDDICADFEANGILLEHMYNELKVPLDWVGSKVFFEKWSRTIVNICRLFDFQIHKDRIQSAYDTITAGGTIDFGLLDEAFQKKIIRLLLSENANQKQMSFLNPPLARIGSTPNAKDIIKSNRNAVLRNYSLTSYRHHLLRTYKQAAAAAVRQRIDKTKLLNEFFVLNKFSLLKWGDYGAC